MPKIEKPPYSVRRVLTNANSKYAKEKWQLLGRAKIFGRQIREYRTTKKAAEELGEKYLGELRAHGQQATPLSDIERAGAVQAIRLLGDSGDLVTAVKFFLDHAPRKGDITVAKATELFAATRGIAPECFRRPKGMWRRKVKVANWSTVSKHSDSHRTTLQNRLRRFNEAFGREIVRTFGTRASDVRSYLETNFRNERSLQNHRSTLHSFFEWCVELEYCAKNPAVVWTQQKLRLESYAKDHTPDILTPRDFAALLHAAQRHDHEMIPYLILGGFMALRPEELQKLSWECVKPSFVYIPPEMSKTGDRAELAIQRPLRPWLALCRKRAGPIAPPNASRRRLTLWRRIHGFIPDTATLAEKRTCPPWPHDGLRHSYGTYRYKVVGDIGTVCAEMRHEDPLVFRKHYVKRGVTLEDAENYFSADPLSPEDLQSIA